MYCCFIIVCQGGKGGCSVCAASSSLCETSLSRSFAGSNGTESSGRLGPVASYVSKESSESLPIVGNASQGDALCDHWPRSE